MLERRFRSVGQFVHQALDILFADLCPLALSVGEIRLEYGEVLLGGLIVYILGAQETDHGFKLALVAQIVALHDLGDVVAGDVKDRFGGRCLFCRSFRLNLLDSNFLFDGRDHGLGRAPGAHRNDSLFNAHFNLPRKPARAVVADRTRIPETAATRGCHAEGAVCADIAFRRQPRLCMAVATRPYSLGNYAVRRKELIYSRRLPPLPGPSRSRHRRTHRTERRPRPASGTGSRRSNHGWS